ncbi:MAG: (2Fe-2S)-binding protein [Planctomycetaceae bacterium]|nr:(2Fe-2S)-binding protein [Planctomycetaceae bacterium]
MKDQDLAPWPQAGFDRRAFLKGSSAAAAATTLATHATQAQAQAAAPEIVGRQSRLVELKVNGKTASVRVEPRSTLLDVLRYQLQLTGAKPVSIDGSSGASTVIVDGKPIAANTTLALDCVGKSIQTVESLGGEKPDAVVSAFVHADAMQCGFCTPGFVVAVRAFLDKNPGATEEQIRSGLNGNLCRCGTYANVVMAALEVVKGGSRG